MGLFLFSYADTGNHPVPTLPLPVLTGEGRYLEYRSSHLDSSLPGGYECLIASGMESQTGDFACTLPLAGASVDGGMALVGTVPCLESLSVAAIPDISCSLITAVPKPEVKVWQRGGLSAALPLPETDIHGLTGHLGSLTGTLPRPGLVMDGSRDTLADMTGYWPGLSAVMVSLSGAALLSADLPGPAALLAGHIETDGAGVLVYEDPVSAENPTGSTYSDEVLKWKN